MALSKVRYKGLSDVRVMSQKDLAAAGVGVDRDLRWDPSNRRTIFVEDLSDDLLKIFREEGTFTVSEVDAETGKTVQEFVKGAPLDDTGSVVKDGNTGQTSRKR